MKIYEEAYHITAPSHDQGSNQTQHRRRLTMHYFGAQYQALCVIDADTGHYHAGTNSITG